MCGSGGGEDEEVDDWRRMEQTGTVKCVELVEEVKVTDKMNMTEDGAGRGGECGEQGGLGTPSPQVCVRNLPLSR